MMPSGHPDAQKLGSTSWALSLPTPPDQTWALGQWGHCEGPVTEGWGARAKHR